uniref:Transmembrane protein 254-like n=1 Tax=Phallusia mammillata TaxID=59560 RepID=A0A6F9DUG3_9ASCI|nr:transmembrane protein 254-like [Phallusia mammillata]
MFAIVFFSWQCRIPGSVECNRHGCCEYHVIYVWSLHSDSRWNVSFKASRQVFVDKVFGYSGLCWWACHGITWCRRTSWKPFCFVESSSCGNYVVVIRIILLCGISCFLTKICRYYRKT